MDDLGIPLLLETSISGELVAVIGANFWILKARDPANPKHISPMSWNVGNARGSSNKLRENRGHRKKPTQTIRC